MKYPVLGNVTAIVLAGGVSTRMGGIDKSMLPVRGVPIIQHIVRQLETWFDEIIISGEEKKYSFLGHRVIPDISKGRGPLMGIYSCLISSEHDLNFITACDIPDINIGFVLKMLELSEEADIVMPVQDDTKYEPLNAIYRKSVIPVAGELLKKGKLRISGLFDKVETKFISFDGRGWYFNLNCRDDYDKYNESNRGPFRIR